MNYRIITRRAHKVVIPFRQDDAFVAVHSELFNAFQNDKLNEEIAALLAAELDKEFQETRS